MVLLTAITSGREAETVFVFLSCTYQKKENGFENGTLSEGPAEVMTQS